MLSGIMFGLGLALVFMTCLNYITDAYTVYAASALAASSMSRSVFGAALPLAARKMYASLGVGWATSCMGFVAIGLGCVPFIFMKYGRFKLDIHTLLQSSTFFLLSTDFFF